MRHEGVNTDQYSSVGKMEERKKGRRINLRKHCSCRDNMNAYCEPPQAFSQFSNGVQTNRTKATVSMCDLSTRYQTISVWVQGLRSVFECEVGVYSGWMTLSLCGALPSCHTTKCHRTNLWVFFTNPVTLWPATQKTSPHRLVWWLPIAVYLEARIPSSHVERGECHTCSH